MNYTVEILETELGKRTLAQADADHGEWKLLRSFSNEYDGKDAHAYALTVRDRGRDTGDKPVVRVRCHGKAVSRFDEKRNVFVETSAKRSVTELITKRDEWPQRKGRQRRRAA